MWQRVNAQTSATHQTLRAENMPYQPLLIITHIQLTQRAACDKGLTLKRQLYTPNLTGVEHAISTFVDHNPYSAYSACCMWQRVNAQTSATHQTLRAKNIPYQPLLIITHIQLTHCAACDKGLTQKRQLHTKPYGRRTYHINTCWS